MSNPSRSRRNLRLLSVAVGLVIPSLTLIPLGSFWLWERGLIVYWAIATGLLVGIAYFVQLRVFRKRPSLDDIDVTVSDGETKAWTPLEALAWDDVVAIAGRVDPSRISNQQEALALAFQTIEVVARRIHPEVGQPLWQFTVPEAFAMLERVSRRLGMFVDEHVPLSDRLTVAHALALYRWRGTLETAEKAYDIWRLIRLANPVAAATNEIRERLSKQMVHWGREHITRQLAEAYVKEVGRAAIDLYGGRLGVGHRLVDARLSDGSIVDLGRVANAIAEPLRILIAGQVGSGKSSLINALAGEARAAVDALPTTSQFVPYELKHEGIPTALIIDSPGLEQNLATIDDLVQRAIDCDLVLWIAAANAADRDLDHRAITAFRSDFAAKPDRRLPPMLLVLTNIDRLRPFADWSPPYNDDAATSPKAQSIRAARKAAAADLKFGEADVVTISLNADRAPYNIDILWNRIVAALPDAQRAQLLRQLHDLKSRGKWSRLWSQTVSAGRVIGQSLKR